MTNPIRETAIDGKPCYFWASDDLCTKWLRIAPAIDRSTPDWAKYQITGSIKGYNSQNHGLLFYKNENEATQDAKWLIIAS